MVEFKSDFIHVRGITCHVLSSDKAHSETILFLHGNASDSRIWKTFATLFSDNYNLIIPDLRGYGKTRPAYVDATEGVAIWAKDIAALLTKIGKKRVHVAGHSLGGMVAMSLGALFPELVTSLTLLSPGSPFGYGGTKDRYGNPVNEDFSGCGAGLAQQEFIMRIANKDLTEANPSTSPSVMIKRLYFGNGFKVTEKQLELLLNSMFTMKTGEGYYPGDMSRSDLWPGYKPGNYGPANAVSAKYNQSLVPSLLQLSLRERPPLLWIHGTADKLVSNQPASDAGMQGKLGLIPDWPGEDIYPPQPMFDQLNYFYSKYSLNHHHCRKIILPDIGHTPFIESPEAVFNYIRDFI